MYKDVNLPIQVKLKTTISEVKTPIVRLVTCVLQSGMTSKLSKTDDCQGHTFSFKSFNSGFIDRPIDNDFAMGNFSFSKPIL